MTSAEQLLPAVDEVIAFARSRLAKAAAPAGLAARDALVGPLAADLAEYLAAMRDRVLATLPVSKAIEVDWSPDDVDWTVEDSELGAVLARWYPEIAGTAYAAVADQLAVELRFDARLSPARELLATVGERVAGITATSRQALASATGRAIATGSSVDDLAGAIRSLFSDWASWRAQTVALTETATVYNAAALGAYQASGLVEGVTVFDGESCGWEFHEDPDPANGSTRTLAEARAHPIAHPNCQRAFGAVVAR